MVLLLTYPVFFGKDLIADTVMLPLLWAYVIPETVDEPCACWSNAFFRLPAR